MYLKIEGVDGESKDSAHKNWIDVLNWSWGITQSGSAHVGGGAGSGKANVHDLTITKYVDKSSPTVMKHCASGKHFPECKLVVRKAGGDSPVEYLKIKMSDVMISGWTTGASAGEDRVSETITMNFAKVHTEYTEQMADGSAGAGVPFGWDIASNKPM